jgi:thymidylate kinase
VSGVEQGSDRLTIERRQPRRAGPLVLEFIGLPGAGKTTIAARLLSELRARGLTCTERRGRGARASRALNGMRRAAFLLRNRALLTGSLRFAARVRPISLGRLARGMKLSTWARQLRSYAVSDVDVVVLDQGPVQDAWSVTVPANAWDEAAMRAIVGPLVQTTGVSRAFVYVTVDIETALQRLRQRRGVSSRFDHLSADVARAWLVRYERSLSSIAQYAIIAADAPVVRVDGNTPIEAQCRQVADFVAAARTGSAPWLAPVIGAGAEGS